jgi:hypothetical protein
MFKRWLQHLRIPSKPEQTQGPDNPDEGKLSAAIETATEAMKNLIDSTLAAVSKIREMASSIGLDPLLEIMRKAYEGLCFVIGLPTTPVSNTVLVSGSTTS